MRLCLWVPSCPLTALNSLTHENLQHKHYDKCYLETQANTVIQNKQMINISLKVWWIIVFVLACLNLVKTHRNEWMNELHWSWFLLIFTMGLLCVDKSRTHSLLQSRNLTTLKPALRSRPIIHLSLSCLHTLTWDSDPTQCPRRNPQKKRESWTQQLESNVSSVVLELALLQNIQQVL